MASYYYALSFHYTQGNREAIVWNSLLGTLCSVGEDGGEITIVCKDEQGCTKLLYQKFIPWIIFPAHQAPYVRELHNFVTFEVEHLKPLVGFTLQPQRMIRAKFTKRSDFSVYEKMNGSEFKTRPEMQYMHQSGMRVGWFDSTTKKPKKNNTLPLLTIMAYDLETTGLNPDCDRIEQCSLVFWDTSEAKPLLRDVRTVVLCVQPTTSEEGCPIIQCHTEKGLLNKMMEIITKTDPDILTGYNLSFDNKFLMVRANALGVNIDVSRINHKSSFREKDLSSSALGTNILYLWDIPGRCVIDLYTYAKQTFLGLPSYKLDEVAQSFLGRGKMDIPFGKLLHAFSSDGTAEERGLVALYCEIDSRLCLELMCFWKAHVACLEEASCCSVNPSTITNSGRQGKIVSMILGEMYGKYYFNPPATSNLDGYQGAMVIETVPGLYAGFHDQVLCCDFASLYPSIMRSYNICPSMLVPENLSDKVDHTEYTVEGIKVRIASTDDKPIFTVILERLLEERAKIRAQMKSETDELVLSVMDNRQKSRKVACNSVYGLLGTREGMLPMQILAALVTSKGRELLQYTQSVAENEYGCETVAGDSVMPYTPVYILHRGVLIVDTVELLCDHFPNTGWRRAEDGKEICVFTCFLQTWTESGWTRLEYVVRHLTSKSIFRVLTHTGLVDVTCDHSLLLPNGDMVKPYDVSVSTKLLHADPPPLPENNSSKISSDEARILGFFGGDGSCGRYCCPSGKKASWALNNSNLDLITKYKDLCELVYGTSFHIYSTRTKNVGEVFYKLCKKGNVSSFVDLYRRMCYNSTGTKVVPVQILNSSSVIRQSYLEGFYDADGHKNNADGVMTISQKNHITVAGLVWLIRSLGHDVSLSTRDDKPLITRLRWGKGPLQKPADQVKKLYELQLNSNVTVYDLCTSNHHFAAGPGRMIVHNTDSVMVKLPPTEHVSVSDRMKHVFAVGSRMCQDISLRLPGPLQLELEAG